MVTNNLVATLYEMAATRAEQLAIAIPAAPGKPLPQSGPVPYRTISFKSLAEATQHTALFLKHSGFEQGDRVVLMVPPSLEFFTLIYAFLQSGIIPVLIDPGIGLKNLKTCIDEAEPVGFIGITKAHLARVLLGWGKNTIKKKVTLGLRLCWGGKRLSKISTNAAPLPPVSCIEAKPDDIASISFTSGSTGIPKGVISTQGNMRQQVEIIRQLFNIQAGEVDLPTFPPFAFFNPLAGVSTVIPDMDFTQPARVDPAKLIRVIDQFQVSSMFGSPALLDRVGRYGQEHQVKLTSLKRVLSAGAPVSARILRRFASMLNPDTPIFTPYGATEAMPVTAINSFQLLQEDLQLKTENGAGICIGTPVYSTEIKVIRISDEPIAQWTAELELEVGEIGEIVVKGPHITKAYFNREAATRMAKIQDKGQIWHRMGDLGYKDAEGKLWFCGRKAHRVKTVEKTLYSVQCESIFNKHPLVKRTALVGVGEKAILCVEAEQGVPPAMHEKIKSDLLAWAANHELTRDIQTLLFHPSFPVDIRHNAKIFREKLAVWAASVPTTK